MYTDEETIIMHAESAACATKREAAIYAYNNGYRHGYDEARQQFQNSAGDGYYGLTID